MRAFLKRFMQALTDLAVLSSALWLAYLIRFDWKIPAPELRQLYAVWPYVVFLQYAMLLSFEVPRFSWRYAGLRETVRIAAALSVAAAVMTALRLSVPGWRLPGPWSGFSVAVPLSVTAMDYGWSFLGIVGVRAVVRLLFERADRKRRPEERRRAVPTLLLGAGQAGLTVAKELRSRPDLGIEPVGFLDDDPLKKKRTVHGIPVLGPIDRLEESARKYGAKQALVTIAGASGRTMRRINDLCGKAGLPVKVVPGLYEIVGGKVSLSRIRNVAIEDLLGREPVRLDEDSIAKVVRDRVLLVTGAGGTIGSELCRQICRFGPMRLVLVERYENGLFEIHRRLAGEFPEVKTAPCLADVRDAKRLSDVFARHKPVVVFHAAAHKHVPMMEWNPGEAIKNNVLGTKTAADVAATHGVEKFILISTDKAVNPSSVMGASKRAAELYVQSLSTADGGTRFAAVRFGNVLGSSGSVVPLFKEQIAKGGPVTVTDSEMKRYFMTIPEACGLVLQTAALGRGGEIFVLDMGEPMKIVDLARDLIRLSGFRPGEDVEIRFTGVRPGEKLFEELSTSEEENDRTRHPKIFVMRGRPPERDTVAATVKRLAEISADASPETVRRLFAEILPEYSPRSGGGGAGGGGFAADGLRHQAGGR